MTDELERRWDDAMEQAWAGLRRRIADRMAGLDEGEMFCVQVPGDEERYGASPYCQVLLDEGRLRVEAVSNACLDEEFALDDQQAARLGEIGFGAPADQQSPNFWADVEQREADRAAWMVVEAFRQVYAVLHPTYLDSGDEPDEIGSLEQPVGEAGGAEEAEPFAPGDSAAIRRGLEQIAVRLTGQPVEWDEDNDLVIETDRGRVWVTVSEQLPRILVHAILLAGFEDEQRALVEVNLLNRHEFGLTFLLADGRISVRRELPVGVFVPRDIEAEITRFTDGLDRWIVDLQTRLRPAPRPEHQAGTERSDDRLEQAMRVLRELESEERGSVDPATMVRIFHGDRALLLAAIRDAGARASRWGSRLRKAEREERNGFVKVCTAQQRYHRELRGRLRRALRLAVQATAKRDRAEQLALFTEDEATA